MTRKVVCMFRIKFPTKRIFRIFPILRTDAMAPFCNLFIERPSYVCVHDDIVCLWFVFVVLGQMLNCCIERRKARESSLYGDVSMTDGNTPGVKQSSQSDEDDDEFYECETETAVTAAAGTSTGVRKDDEVLTMECDDADGWRDAGLDASLEFADSLLYQADGRLKPCTDLCLLNVNEQLYVPVTQEPAPMTEDMLEEHAEVLARCGRLSDHITYLSVV